MPRLRTVVIDHSFGCWGSGGLPPTVEGVLAVGVVGGVTGVLVALQRTGGDRPLPPAAEHVVALLRSWGPGPEHLTGLALAGITLPSRLGPRFVDALVFTRCGVVVIAAHEPGPAEWPGPGDRTGAVVAATRGALAGHEGGRHVTGLVAVVPPSPASLPEPARETGSNPLPDDEQAPAEAVPARQPPPSRPPALRWPDPHPVPGVAVVLADPRGLRRIIAQHNRWHTVWSADDVLDACYALSLAHLAPPRAALLADGFPAWVPARLPRLPAVVPVPPEPPQAVPAAVEPPVPAGVPRGPVSAVFPRQRPIRQVPWALLFVLAVLVVVGVIAAVFVAQVFHGS